MNLVPWSNYIDEQLILGKECLVELPMCSKLVQSSGGEPTYLSLTFDSGYYYFKTIDIGDLSEVVMVTDDVEAVKKNVLLITVIGE